MSTTVRKSSPLIAYRLKILRHMIGITGPHVNWLFAVHAIENTKRTRAIAWLAREGYLKRREFQRKNGFGTICYQITAVGRFCAELGVL